MLSDPTRASLTRRALDARQNAYALYSHFAVGAALLAADREIYVGANVENASYGLTICAERVAAGSAVAAGQRQFLALAVATPGAQTPCGACRQVLAEFCEDLPILLVDADHPESIQETTLRELFPRAFGPDGFPSG